MIYHPYLILYKWDNIHPEILYYICQMTELAQFVRGSITSRAKMYLSILVEAYICPSFEFVKHLPAIYLKKEKLEVRNKLIYFDHIY